VTGGLLNQVTVDKYVTTEALNLFPCARD